MATIFATARLSIQNNSGLIRTAEFALAAASALAALTAGGDMFIIALCLVLATFFSFLGFAASKLTSWRSVIFSTGAAALIFSAEAGVLYWHFHYHDNSSNSPTGVTAPEHDNPTKTSECDHLLGSEDFISELNLIGEKHKCPLPVRASRANFDKATVIWTYEPREMFYFLYTNTNNWVPHNEPNSCDEPRCKANSPENRKYFEKLYGKIPAGKYPPFGGLTILMGDDARVFKSTGWGEWACDFKDNTVFYAEYDEGKIIGPFPTFWDAASDVKEQVFIIKNDGTYEVRTMGKTGVKCDNIFSRKP